MLMEGGADKRLRKRGINGKEPEGQAPRRTGGDGGKEGNGGTEGTEGPEGTGEREGTEGSGGTEGTGGNGGQEGTEGSGGNGRGTEAPEEPGETGKPGGDWRWGGLYLYARDGLSEVALVLMDIALGVACGGVSGKVGDGLDVHTGCHEAADKCVAGTVEGYVLGDSGVARPCLQQPVCHGVGRQYEYWLWGSGCHGGGGPWVRAVREVEVSHGRCVEIGMEDGGSGVFSDFLLPDGHGTVVHVNVVPTEVIDVRPTESGAAREEEGAFQSVRAARCCLESVYIAEGQDGFHTIVIVFEGEVTGGVLCHDAFGEHGVEELPELLEIIGRGITVE